MATYRDLLALNDPARAYKSPLAVICHIDVNAFFAQYESNRLNLTADDPVVCLQWNSLIAVSYAARRFGVSRMDSLDGAKLKCPDLIAAHTAVFKKGEPTWKYVDYRPSPINHKVSLDPYRRESRKMMRLFGSFCDLVEKASVDESFLDLGRLVFARVLELIPDLLDGMQSQNDPLPDLQEYLDKLELPDWHGEVILEPGEDTPSVKTWDDLTMLIGCDLSHNFRERLRNELGYTTSGGIGRVKTIAKLASGYKKPDNQTTVRNGAIGAFLDRFKLTDFWSMGGKTGEFIRTRLDADGEENDIAYIRNEYSLKDLMFRFDKDRELAEKVYHIVRGSLAVPLEQRTAVKSMASTKNFRGKCVKNSSDMLGWFEVFVGDLVLRLQELDEEEASVRRPTKLTLGMRCGPVSRTKQCTMVPIKDYTEITKKLKELSIKLLNDLERSWKNDPTATRMYPCEWANLAISGFESFNGFNRLDDLMDNVERRKLERPLVKAETAEPPIEPTEPPDSILPPDIYKCPDCGEHIPCEQEAEHKDYHFALSLDSQFNMHAETSYGEQLLRRKSAQPSKTAKPAKSTKKGKRPRGQSTLPF